MKTIARIANTLSILLIVLGLLVLVHPVKPVLTFLQYQELSRLVNDAETAAAEGLGGRHALLVATLQQWGFFVTGASWQVVKFAQALLEKHWIPGTEPKKNPDEWDW